MDFILQIWDESGTMISGAASQSSLDARSRGILESTLREKLRGVIDGGPRCEQLGFLGRCYECTWSELVGRAGERQGWASLLLDVHEREQARADLSRRMLFEQLITQLSTHFIALKPAEIDAGIDHALKAIGEFCSVDRAYIFLFTAGANTMSNTHEWCARGIEPQIQLLQEMPVETFPWWVSRIRQQAVIHIPRVGEMPPEARAEQEILEQQSIRSVVVVPTVYQGVAVGFLGFDAVRAEKAWSGEDIALLRLVGEMLVSAIERKRSEEQRRSLQAQLVQARSLENVAKLAGGVAHDFNNLLAIILNYAAILKQQVTEPKLNQLASDLLQVTKQGADLTRQLLTVGRRGVVEPVLLSLNVVVLSLDKLLRRTLGESARLELTLAEHLAMVQMGLPQLEQVIMNLALNARDAMLEGGVMSVRTQNWELAPERVVSFLDLNPGPYVVLEISDTGRGMAPEVAARAFEPFFTTKNKAGTGLGLSTVHGIVKQAGGHVEIKSQAERGTTVTVYLPAVPGEQPEPSSTPPEQAPPIGNDELVLVVEDSDRLRELVSSILEQHRYRVLEANSPLEALRVCERHAGAIDLLLSDVIMPEMSGRKLADLLSERFGLQNVSFMSGYDDDVLAKHGVLPEGTLLLQKPFLDRDLLIFVRRALDRRK